MTHNLFNRELIEYNKFIKDFSSMFFSTKKKPKARKAFSTLKPAKTVTQYTHKFNLHACGNEWDVLTLISWYTKCLKKDLQLSLLSCDNFPILEEFQKKLTRSIESEIKDTDNTPCTLYTSIKPNVMNLLATWEYKTPTDKVKMIWAGVFCWFRSHR